VLKDHNNTVFIYDTPERKHHSFSTNWEFIQQILQSPDGNLVFFQVRSPALGKVIYEVFDRKTNQLLPSVTLRTPGRMNFSSDGSLLICNGGFFDLRKCSWIDFKVADLPNFFELPQESSTETPMVSTSDEKKISVESTDSKGCTLVVCGKGGLFLWSSQYGIQCLLENSEVTSVNLSPDYKRLITGGGDGVCRVWDLSDRKRVVLKSCTSGLSFYAHGVTIDSETKISTENRRILESGTENVRASGEVRSQEEKRAESDKEEKRIESDKEEKRIESDKEEKRVESDKEVGSSLPSSNPSSSPPSPSSPSPPPTVESVMTAENTSLS